MQVRPLTLFTAALGFGLAGGFCAEFVTGARRENAPEVAAAPSGIEASLVALERRQGEIEKGLGELRDAVARVEAGARVPVGEIDAAVERALAARAAPAAVEPSSGAAETSAAPKSKEERVREAIAALEDPSLSDAERQRMWRELAKEGLTDAIVAEYERRADLAPSDPEKKVELGHAYLQKIFEVGNSPEAGVWATKADRAFDAALELDPQHWEARFSKAVSLSFWPPVFGKQNEAIEHFERLVTQQASAPSRPEFARVHLLLGNMYQQVGKSEQAIASWERGLAAFPNDEELKQQLALVREQ
jgi:tetratricopeptide (TPR) repeat protein